MKESIRVVVRVRPPNEPPAGGKKKKRANKSNRAGGQCKGGKTITDGPD